MLELSNSGLFPSSLARVMHVYGEEGRNRCSAIEGVLGGCIDLHLPLILSACIPLHEPELSDTSTYDQRARVVHLHIFFYLFFSCASSCQRVLHVCPPLLLPASSIIHSKRCV